MEGADICKLAKKLMDMDILNDSNQPKRSLAEVAQVLKEKLWDHYREQAQDKENFKKELRTYEMAALEDLLQEMASIENEEYEICQAIIEVIEEKQGI